MVVWYRKMVVKKIIKINKLKTKTVCMKPGQALIWAANLLHGGKKIIDKKKTRLSQVIHYHFENCKFFFLSRSTEY